MQKKYKCLYVYHLQCVVSNGETTHLVLVKGCAQIGLVQKIKEKNLIKTVGINFRNFGIDEECIRLNTSSLCLSNIRGNKYTSHNINLIYLLINLF